MLVCLIILFIGGTALESEDFYLGSLTSKLYPLLGVLVFSMVIMEFVYSKPVVRLIYIILIINFLIFIVKDLNMINMCIWFFTLIYFVPFIIIYLRTKNAKTEVKMIKEEGKLDVGILNKKHDKAIKGSIVIATICAMLSILIFNLVFEINIVISLLLAFIVCFIIIVMISISSNPLIKLEQLIFNDVKINEYLSELNKLKENNLHSETLNYLCIFEANYMALVNKEKSIELFENVKYPVHKPYIKIYETIELCYLFNKRDQEAFYNKLNEFKLKYPKDKNIVFYDYLFKIYDKNEVIDNFEKLNDINIKNKFARISRALNLMMYYEVREDHNKAKEYAKIIIDMNANEYVETYNKALSILEHN
jgi:hypothetical protein